MKSIVMIIATASVVFCAAQSHASNCWVSTSPVVFGSYNVFSTSPTTSRGTITLTCNNHPSKPMQATISISPGGSGSFNPRQMRSSASDGNMNYNLYTDASLTSIWGDGTGGTSTVSGSASRQSPLVSTIYGSIPARQNLSAGNYSDNLVVTVTW